MPDSPEQTLRRYYQEVWVERRVQALEHLLALTYHDYDPPRGYGSDRVSAHQLAAALVSNMRDNELTILELIATDRAAAAHWRLEWTQRGPFLGNFAADGQRLTLRGSDLVRVNAGQITHVYHVENLLGTLRLISEKQR